MHTRRIHGPIHKKLFMTAHLYLSVCRKSYLLPGKPWGNERDGKMDGENQQPKSYRGTPLFSWRCHIYDPSCPLKPTPCPQLPATPMACPPKHNNPNQSISCPLHVRLCCKRQVKGRESERGNNSSEFLVCDIREYNFCSISLDLMDRRGFVLVVKWISKLRANPVLYEFT